MAAADKGPAAVCEGGPWDRWVYYDTDLEDRRASALAMGRVFEYRPSGERDDKDRLVWLFDPPKPEETLPPEPPAPSQPKPIRYSDDLDPVECSRCGEPVYVLRRNGSPLTLDVDIIRGGLWRFDERGRPLRRSTVEVFEETRSADPAYLGGYPVHECVQEPEGFRGSKD